MSNMNKNFIAGLLVLSVVLFESATNIFLPALPSIQEFFKESVQHVQMTLSVYLLGFALLGVIAGPISDAIGRKPVIVFGLGLFLLGSFFSYIFADESLNMLITARFFQGLGAGVATVLVIASIKDMFDEIKCARMLSLMGMVIATAPMIAPLVGGAIAEVSHWMVLFSLMFYGAAVVFVIYLISGKETNQHKKKLNLNFIWKNYRAVLANPNAMRYIIISMLLYGALFAWVFQAPFFFEEEFQLGAFDYALFAACGPLAYMSGSFFNYKCLPKFGFYGMITIGLIAATVGASVLLILCLFKIHSLGFYLGGFLSFNAGLAPVFSNSSTKSVSLVDDKRGAASALLATFEQSFAAFTTYSVGLFNSANILPAVVIMFIALILAVLLFRSISESTKKSAITA